MSTAISERNSMDHGMDTKDSAKNGLVNGLVLNKKHNMKQNHKIDFAEMSDCHISAKSGKESMKASLENHCKVLENSVENSKKKAKKKKLKANLDSNENLNNLKHDGGISEADERESESVAKGSVEFPSCSKTSETSIDSVSGALDKLVINDNSNNISATASEKLEACQKNVEFVPYESELQMPLIMKIIQNDLSEPYSIYTYRYFIHNWPKLCFLAMYDGQCVGAIVCKLDLHRKVVKRGYIAMLAVDQNYRNMRIGSTLVQMAIQEMTNGDADEVVLETEVTNKPALKLYEKLGFVRDKRLFRYYLNGVDALRLKLWLR